jgi:hypothetical protein
LEPGREVRLAEGEGRKRSILRLLALWVKMILSAGFVRVGV